MKKFIFTLRFALLGPLVLSLLLPALFIVMLIFLGKFELSVLQIFIVMPICGYFVGIIPAFITGFILSFFDNKFSRKSLLLIYTAAGFLVTTVFFFYILTISSNNEKWPYDAFIGSGILGTSGAFSAFILFFKFNKLNTANQGSNMTSAQKL